MSFIRRREIPLLLTSFILIVVLFNHYIKGVNWLSTLNLHLKTWGVVILAFSMGLAAVQLFRFEMGRIRKRESEWQLSIWGLFCFIATFFIALIPPMGSNPPFTWILLAVMIPMDAVMWGLCGFSQIIAMYNALRVKSFEAGLLILSVILFLLYAMPALGGSSIIAGLGDWYFKYISVGGYRGVVLASAAGVMALTVRVIIGRERGYFR
jgi:hypothetical protein